MQPHSRLPAAKDNSIITQTAADLDAATAMRFAASRGTRMSRHTWKQNITTIMQPFHCDLQPNSKTPYNYLRTREQPHIAEHQGRTDSHLEPPQPQPPHTQGTLHCRLLPRKNTRFRAPASSPKQTPCNIRAAITMRFAAAGAHSCSQYMVICIHALQNNNGEAITRQNDTVRNRRTDKVPFIAACSHLTRKNTRFRSPASFPTQVPCNSHAAITMRFAAAGTYSITLRFAPTRCRTPRENQSHVKANGPQPPHRRGTCFIAACSHFTRNNTRFRSPASFPTQVPCNRHAAITKRFAAAGTYSCSHYIANLHPRVAEHQGRTNHASKRTVRNRRTDEVPFIAACSHFTRNNTRFRSPASFPKQTPCNRHAAITMRFAAAGTYSCSHYIAICIHALQNTKVEPITRQNERSGTAAQTSSHFAWKNTRFRSPASPQNKPHATFLQPLQCVLQQHIRIHAAMSLRFAPTRCRTPRENQSHVKANGPQPPHRRGTCFIAACSHFTRKTSQGFVFRLPPQHKPHATFMQPLQCVLQHHLANTHLFTHMATKHDKNSHHPKWMYGYVM